MTISQLIRPGDKMEIRLIQNTENEKKSNGTAKTYMSQVLNFTQNGNIEAAMPIEEGQLVLLLLNVRYEFIFYSAGGLYKCIGLVKERYRRDNRYMLEIEQKTPLERYQRREYYRYACTLEFSYYELTKEQAALDSVEAIFASMCEEFFVPVDKLGTVVDISGGGAKFRSEFELNAEDDILLSLHLTNDMMDKQYYILGSVIACYQTKNLDKELYECRVKFMIKDNKIREEIIRYIFEEERRLRLKEKNQ